jgi:isoquinoline 1-oxidoreductase alpha subunit
MSPLTFTVNDQVYTLDVDPNMPLLWAIRDFARLTGTKYGCGIAQCGACTVHLDGKAVRSCSIPVSAAVNKKVVTIEGLSPDGSHPLQRAWQEEDVPQCGYCQTGQIMTAAGLLDANGNPTDEEIVTAMTGNICRCGTYKRIHKAIKRAVELTAKK